MMRTLLLALVVATLALQPALAIGIGPGTDRETILERLVDAEKTLQSWNLAGTKTRLDKLVDELANDHGAFNQAVKRKTEEIVEAITKAHLRDAEEKLTKLIVAVRDGVMPRI
jgi:hypothetical protein